MDEHRDDIAAEDAGTGAGVTAETATEPDDGGDAVDSVEMG